MIIFHLLECPDNCDESYCLERQSWTDINDATNCTSCKSSYFLKGELCEKCPIGCKNCTTENECDECLSNYVFKSPVKDCTACPSNCLRCSWNIIDKKSECEFCSEGYVLDDKKTCTSCGSNCLSCSFIQGKGIECNRCHPNMYITTGTSVECKLCSSALPGCKRCSNEDTCIECLSSSYSLSSSGKCESCSPIHAACISCDVTSGSKKCSKCSSGYYVKDDSCASCSRNCDTCRETNDKLECTKCKTDYTVIKQNNCDRCPDNCLDCGISNDKLVCKSNMCSPGYTLNDDKSCAKCPNNCKACTWSTSNSRTECNGNSASHSCVENENGKSWTRKSDGTCVACPDKCFKCYFTDETLQPICYASKCSIKHGFDDATGTCFACPSGCDYCKRTLKGDICQKCSEKHAPKYTSDNTIESCEWCSIWDCDYCEVLDGSVKCRRSPCASKEVSSANKKFSFTNNDCSGNCPIDSSCDSGKINDENEICYCRSCPAGSAVILVGSNAGVCKSCGPDCEKCELNSVKNDVECKTCKGVKQWLTVEVGPQAVSVKGCFDCSAAQPHCKQLEYAGNPPICRCKMNNCIGDQTQNSPTKRHTVIQETSGSQRCRGCSDLFPKALWCRGNYASESLESCQQGYQKLSGTNTCKAYPDNCANWGDTQSTSDVSRVDCLKCIPGYYLFNGNCISCSSVFENCLECAREPSSVVCTECSSGSGFNCKTPCTSSPIPDCGTMWATTNANTCKCKTCSGSSNPQNLHIVAPYVASVLGSSCGGKTMTISGCNKYGSGSPDICVKCNVDHALSPLRDACLGTSFFKLGCKEGYSFAFDPSSVLCRVPKDGFMEHSVKNNPPIKVADDNLANSGSGCTGYLSINSDSSSDGRCGGCETGKVIDVLSEKKYTCTSCSTTGFPNCEFAVAYKGSCRCGRCKTSNSIAYVMRPDQRGCVECLGIVDCSVYTLRLLDGELKCACASCGNNKLVNSDGFSCIDCSSKLCSPGEVKAVDSKCECSCNDQQLMKNNTNGCVSCGTNSDLPNCKSGHYKLLENDQCGCSECISGHVLKSDQSACLSCTKTTPGNIIPNCKVCLESTTVSGTIDKCISCDDGYALNPADGNLAATCLSCQSGCQNCTVDRSKSPPTTERKCTACKTGYTLNTQGTCIRCPTEPKTCSECRIDPKDSTNTLCTQFGCGSNALRDSDFKCESCKISNCAKCVKDVNNVFKCLDCNEKFFMDKDGTCKQCISGCDFCVNGETCIPSGCIEGFIRHRTDGTCQKCTGDGVSRCIYKDTTTDVLVPIISCSENCKKCEIAGKDKCDTDGCKTGFFFDISDQLCYENNPECLISTRINGKIVCSSCNETTSVLVDNECKPCPNECSGCTSNNNQFTCSSCKGGYYKRDDGVCLECPSGCSSCAIVEGRVACEDCLQGYSLQGESCTQCGISECDKCKFDSGNLASCEKCSSKFYLNTDDCGSCPEFCAECTFNQKYTCTKCYDKYAKSLDGKCIKCSSNCAICTAKPDKSTKCIKCISSEFSLGLDGVCRPCNKAIFKNCSICESENGKDRPKCLSCAKGYTLKDDESGCVKCSISGCNDCSHGRVCLKCKRGTYLHNYDRECARKCYECQGNEEECGKDISKIQNITNTVKLIDCGIGDCWVHRREEGDVVTFERSCSKQTCSSGTVEVNCNGGCATGFTLDFSPTKYDCTSCTAAGLDHCTFAVSSGDTCMCGRCTADVAGKVYHKHPTLPGCTQNDEIPNCSSHTLKLKNGAYVVAWTACSGVNVLAEDGLSCVACSKTCTGGSKVVAAGASTCTCDCAAVGFVNTAGDDCITCATAGKAGCSEVHLNGATWECKTCNVKHVLYHLVEVVLFV
ncbi:DgyrCDS832 [Dimorphilus gyrociliatus]|uniref:DgyrCDS832 n=1 Tax=Dimorphilus gyrociliatus TaxID=2664684 RepID=A0A7I8V713_9ANNE|nr:DgyrCDS832 [Dimorphilus gyrociliatus]